MRRVLNLILVSLTLMCSKSGGNFAGTATDVNSGEITGLVLNQGKKYQDSVVVSLYSGSTILSKQTVTSGNQSQSVSTTNGEFKFDNLATGDYSIKVTKGNMVLSENLNIALSQGEQKVVNINIIIVVNQIFNITNIYSNQNVTINNYYFNGITGELDSLENGKYKATFIAVDTVNMNAVLVTGSQNDTISIVFVKQSDGTYISLPLNTTLPIKVNDYATIINNGTGSDSSTVSIDGTVKEDAR